MLGLSRTASYAVRILAHLARHRDEWVRGAEGIARATEVPSSYAAGILHDLGRSGFVRTKAGCHGGYRLARDPDATSAFDIVTAVDGTDLFERCLLGPGRCSEEHGCALHPYWSVERSRIERCLRELTLARIASGDDASTAPELRSAFRERIETARDGHGRGEGES